MSSEPCCPKDFGGSHYHCGGCGEVTGMMGHYVNAKYRDGTPFSGHTCVARVEPVWDGRRLFVEPIDDTTPDAAAAGPGTP